MQLPKVFSLLNDELEKQNVTRDLIICGGAALICLGWVIRKTRDVDVITPDLDEVITKAADVVGKKEGLNPGWLNNGVAPFRTLLPKGWEMRCVPVFAGSHLSVKSLGRQDLLGTKLLGACDRGDDIVDLVGAGITPDELEEARKWVLSQDASEVWPKIVNECCAELLRRIKS